MLDLAGQQRRGPPRSRDRAIAGVAEKLREYAGSLSAWREPTKRSPWPAKIVAVLRAAQAHRRRDQRVEHRLQVERRAADRPSARRRWRSAARATPRGRASCACTSSNSRTFSMAITAWSAKVLTSSICLAGNGERLGARHRSEHADGVRRRAATERPRPARTRAPFGPRGPRIRESAWSVLRSRGLAFD